MNIFLLFTAVAIAVLLLVFGGELIKNRAGTIILVLGVIVVLIIPVTLSVKALTPDPVVGTVEVIDKDYSPAHSSGVGKHRRHSPTCHELVLDPLVSNPDPDEPSDWIRSVCVPNSQWLEVKIGDVVEMGYDKKRHKHWGSYIVGDSAPLRSENGKFRTHCVLNEAQDDLICDEVSEAEYNKRSSKEAIDLINDKDFQKRLEEERLQRNQ